MIVFLFQISESLWRFSAAIVSLVSLIYKKHIYNFYCMKTLVNIRLLLGVTYSTCSWVVHLVYHYFLHTSNGLCLLSFLTFHLLFLTWIIFHLHPTHGSNTEIMQ